jgi:hypothetical protein
MVPDVVDAAKDDILVADAIFLPNSGELFPFQRVTMKGLADHKVCFIQGCRGSSKSWVVARYLLVEALRNKIKIVCTGPTFRQAMIPFQYILEFIEENSGTELACDLGREIESITTGGSKGEAVIKFRNGSVIKALPMGNGARLRGERADILVCDEFFLMEKTMYKSHIVPFLLGHKPLTSIGPKLIMSTSAEYEDSYAYNVFTRMVLPNIERENRLVAADPDYQRKYIAFDWNILDLKAQRLPNGTVYKIDRDVMSILLEGADENERQQVLFNRWIGLSGQFMPTNLIEKMQRKDIKIEHEAQPDCAYSLAIDVATTPEGDHFVIHVLKFLGDRKCAIVNTYMDKGLSADEMAWYIHQFNQKFRPEWIVMDKGGGGLFVSQSLSKRKLIFQNGSEKKIDIPILEHDETRAIDGDKKLILTRPMDDKVRASFAGDRVRGGEHISSEDVFLDLLYNGIRQTLSKVDDRGKCLTFHIPEEAGDQGDEFDRSEIKILSDIRDSIHQLKFLTLKYNVLADGTKEIARSKVNKVPLFTWKSQNKDGASAFCYGYIAYNLHYRDARGMESIQGLPRVNPIRYDDFKRFEHLPEDPSQSVNLFKPR